MKLKSKSFNFMQRTDALLKMMATAKGVTETEIIEEALEQFADENILTFINSMYGEKVDRDTIRADRKRNAKNKKLENNMVKLKEENIKNENSFKNHKSIMEDKPEEIENKQDLNNKAIKYSDDEDAGLSIRDEILANEKKDKDDISERKDTKRKSVLSLDTVSEKALELF